jgi:hypothetical protein
LTLPDTNWFSSRRGNNDWPGSGTGKSAARAIAAAESNNKLGPMKTIVQTVDGRRETIPLREVIPFWFAVSSPLIGVLMGLLGAWFVTWLNV